LLFEYGVRLGTRSVNRKKARAKFLLHPFGNKEKKPKKDLKKGRKTGQGKRINE